MVHFMSFSSGPPRDSLLQFSQSTLGDGDLPCDLLRGGAAEDISSIHRGFGGNCDMVELRIPRRYEALGFGSVQIGERPVVADAETHELSHLFMRLREGHAATHEFVG
jgi:hypothetical protein